MPPEQPSNPKEQHPTPKAKYEGKEIRSGFWVFTPKPGESLPTMPLQSGDSAEGQFLSRFMRRYPEARLQREMIIRGKTGEMTKRLEEEALLPSNLELVEVVLTEQNPTIDAAINALLKRGFMLCGDRFWKSFDDVRRSQIANGGEWSHRGELDPYVQLMMAIDQDTGGSVISASAWEVNAGDGSVAEDAPDTPKERVAIELRNRLDQSFAYDLVNLDSRSRKEGSLGGKLYVARIKSLSNQE